MEHRSGAREALVSRDSNLALRARSCPTNAPSPAETLVLRWKLRGGHLGIDPDEISFTVVLRAARDHLAAHTPCRSCGHRSGPGDLTAAIAAGPRNRTDRTRTAPRTKKEQRTQHTRNVVYTITITESNLLIAT